MQDLRLVGVHDDGEHVVLVATDGSRYRLRVDEALRAAVRRDRARLGQLQIQMEAQLRPRDIQARIRAGETAEDVAAAGGLTLEHVRRYEGPVLAERAHVVGLARRTPYGRSSVAGSLDDVVVSRLSARAVDPEGARWDAWREDDGSWTVQCEFVAGGRGRVARWGFDASARVLSALDDEARWLSEEEPSEPGPLPARRLVSVNGEGRAGDRSGERVYDVEADGGVRTNQTDDLLDALDHQRGVRPESAQPPAPDNSGSAPRVDDLTADPPPAHPAASAPDELEDRTVLPGHEPGPVEAEEPEALEPEAVEPEPTPEPEPEIAAEAPVEKPAPRRRNRSAGRSGGSSGSKRPSVPSWDDIMFGTKKD